MRWNSLLGFGVGAAIVALILRGVANSKKLELVQETIILPDLPEPFDGFRILHLTDLHLPRHSQRATELLAIAEATEPDLICLGGDYAYTALSMPEVDAFLQEIHARWPAVAIYGNADYRPDIRNVHRAHWAEIVPFLENSALCLERQGACLWVVGVGDPHKGRDSLLTAITMVPPDAPVILLAHSPDIILRSLDPRIRLVLSGHTHGGQICLPNGKALYSNTKVSRLFASGRHDVDGTILYVSRGIGSTRLPIRYGCLPEVTVFTLKRG